MKKLMLLGSFLLVQGMVNASTVSGKSHHWCRRTCNIGSGAGYDFSAIYKAKRPGSRHYEMKSSSCDCNSDGYTKISTSWNHH
jgi:hypothetical protein